MVIFGCEVDVVVSILKLDSSCLAHNPLEESATARRPTTLAKFLILLQCLRHKSNQDSMTGTATANKHKTIPLVLKHSPSSTPWQREGRLPKHSVVQPTRPARRGCGRDRQACKSAIRSCNQQVRSVRAAPSGVLRHQNMGGRKGPRWSEIDLGAGRKQISGVSSLNVDWGPEFGIEHRLGSHCGLLMRWNGSM